MPCDDLYLGGVLGASSITGGQSIVNQGIAVEQYGGLFGPPRQRGVIADISGAAGGQSSSAEDRLPSARLFSLPIFISDRNPATGLADGGLSPAEWISANQDTVDAIIHSRDGFLIEYIRCDNTSRYLRALQNGQPSVVARSSIGRSLILSAQATFPYWRSTTTSGPDTISGADTLVIGGTAPVYDATLVFSGDGTFTNSDTGQAITVTGSSGAVTVKTGDGRTVTEAGSPARNLVTVNDDEWMRFDVGTVNVTSTVSVNVTWRNAWSSA